jgi:hypothetical protein
MGVLVRRTEGGYIPAMKKEQKKASSFENDPLAEAILREDLS